MSAARDYRPHRLFHTGAQPGLRFLAEAVEAGRASMLRRLDEGWHLYALALTKGGDLVGQFGPPGEPWILGRQRRILLLSSRWTSRMGRGNAILLFNFFSRYHRKWGRSPIC